MSVNSTTYNPNASNESAAAILSDAAEDAKKSKAKSLMAMVKQVCDQIKDIQEKAKETSRNLAKTETGQA